MFRANIKQLAKKSRSTFYTFTLSASFVVTLFCIQKQNCRCIVYVLAKVYKNFRHYFSKAKK